MRVIKEERLRRLAAWAAICRKCDRLEAMMRNWLDRCSGSTLAWSGWRRMAAVVCILLVVFGASAELNHAHASGRIHADCSLCVTAHSAAQATVYSVTPVVLRRVARCADPEPIFRRRRLDIRLSIRPPPVPPRSL